MDLSSQAAANVAAENGQRNEGCNPMATVQSFQKSFSTTAMGRGHDCATGKASFKFM